MPVKQYYCPDCDYCYEGTAPPKDDCPKCGCESGEFEMEWGSQWAHHDDYGRLAQQEITEGEKK